MSWSMLRVYLVALGSPIPITLTDPKFADPRSPTIAQGYEIDLFCIAINIHPINTLDMEKNTPKREKINSHGMVDRIVNGERRMFLPDRQFKFSPDEVRQARIDVCSAILNMKSLLIQLAVVEGDVGVNIVVKGKYDTSNALPGSQETHNALNALRNLKGSLNEDLSL